MKIAKMDRRKYLALLLLGVLWLNATPSFKQMNFANLASTTVGFIGAPSVGAYRVSAACTGLGTNLKNIYEAFAKQAGNKSPMQGQMRCKDYESSQGTASSKSVVSSQLNISITESNRPEASLLAAGPLNSAAPAVPHICYSVVANISLAGGSSLRSCVDCEAQVINSDPQSAEVCIKNGSSTTFDDVAKQLFHQLEATTQNTPADLRNQLARLIDAAKKLELMEKAAERIEKAVANCEISEDMPAEVFIKGSANREYKDYVLNGDQQMTCYKDRLSTLPKSQRLAFFSETLLPNLQQSLNLDNPEQARMALTTLNSPELAKSLASVPGGNQAIQVSRNLAREVMELQNLARSTALSRDPVAQENLRQRQMALLNSLDQGIRQGSLANSPAMASSTSILESWRAKVATATNKTHLDLGGTNLNIPDRLARGDGHAANFSLSRVRDSLFGLDQLNRSPGINPRVPGGGRLPPFNQSQRGVGTSLNGQLPLGVGLQGQNLPVQRPLLGTGIHTGSGRTGRVEF